MIKLFIFDTVEDAQRFERGDISRRANEPKLDLQPVGMPVAEPATDPVPEVRRPHKKYKKHKLAKAAKSIGAGKGHGTPHCKKCGGAGHRSNSQNCPKYSEASESGKVKIGDDGPLAGDDDDEPRNVFNEVTRDQVQELKDQGLTSLQIAARLKCRLLEVNKYW